MGMQRLALIALAGLLAGGCAATRPKAPAASRSVAQDASQELQQLETPELVKWVLENEALVEWQVGLLAAGCNEVAASARSPAARREALRVKAAYATSSCAIATGSNPLVQVLDLLALATLSHQVWVEEGRAAAQFGAQATPVVLAFTQIRERTREHARKHLSATELQEVEAMVCAWRKAHPGLAVVEFIRFDAFADELAASVGKGSDLGGLLGRVSGQVQSVQFLGERALLLAGRTPRLAEWHAEAAAANVLAQPEVADAMTALKQLGELQRTLPEQFKALQALDARLAAMPAELAGAVAKQPELKMALAQVEQTGQQMKELEGGVRALEKSVGTLATQLAQLNSAADPKSLQQLADTTGTAVMRQARSLVLLATGCAAAVVVLQALLRRWSRQAQARKGNPE